MRESRARHAFYVAMARLAGINRYQAIVGARAVERTSYCLLVERDRLFDAPDLLEVLPSEEALDDLGARMRPLITPVEGKGEC